MSNENTSEIVKYNPLLNYPSLTTKDIEDSNMSDAVKQLVLASQNFPKIKNLDESEVRNSLVETMALIIWESGFNMSKDEQKLLINYMINEINLDFSGLTLEEVKIALKKGIRGQYGDVIGLNVRMMYSWLESYISETKREAMKQLQLIKNNDPEQVSEDIKKNWHNKWLEMCIEAYEEYKEKGETTFIDIKNNLYDYIRFKLKIVDLTKEEVDNIWNHAQLEYRRNHSAENSKNDIELLDFKAAIKRMENGDATEQEKIKIIARRIALNKLFEKIKGANLDLRKVIYEFEKNRLT